MQGRPEVFFPLRVEPAADVAAVAVAGPEMVFAADLGAAEPAAVAAVAVAGPEVAFAADLEAAEPAADVAAVASPADVAGPQASADIVFAFAVLVRAFAAAVGVDSSGHPRSSAFPNGGHDPSSSSSAEAAGGGCVHSSTGVRTNYGLCSILSNAGLHHNRKGVRCYNKPSHGHSNMSDTNGPPRDATTSHSRKICPHLYQEQRTHSSYQAARSQTEAPETRWVAAEKFQYVHPPLPLLEQAQYLPTPEGSSRKPAFSFCSLLCS